MTVLTGVQNARAPALTAGINRGIRPVREGDITAKISRGTRPARELLSTAVINLGTQLVPMYRIQHRQMIRIVDLLNGAAVIRAIATATND